MISDEEDMQKHFEEIKQFLAQDAELLRELKEKNIDAACDIGFTIDAPSNVARFLDIDKEIIRQMADAGIGLSISSYLADEDET